MAQRIASRPSTAEMTPSSIERVEARRQPVEIWAAVGLVLLLVEAYLVAKWVSGPSWRSVPSGPSDPPSWMKSVLNFWQVAGMVLAAAVVYWAVVKPLRKGRGLTFDGLLCVAFLISSPYDPLSNYLNNWFTYNSYLVNRGSLLNVIPGYSWGRPGATVALPLFVIPAAYVFTFVGVGVFGAWLMRRTKARWPQLSGVGLVGVCFLVMMVVDVVLEGLLFMRLGFWHYGGGHLSIAGDQYYKYPLQEMIVVGALFTSVAALRYFRDDRGRSIPERGVDQLAVSSGRKTVMRFLAMLAAAQACLFVFYHLPQGIIASRMTEWPADIQKRSYLTNHICGDGTDYACGGPAVPMPRPGSVHLDPEGRLVVPDGTKLPTAVPFEDTGR
jgi:hypothetical protein